VRGRGRWVRGHGACRVGLSVATASLALVLSGCGAAGAFGGPSSVPATTPGNGTVLDRALPAALFDVVLRDQAGRAVTLGSLRGKVIVVTDFLTTCQEVCPMTSVNVRDVADAVAQAGLASKVQLVEITVDPGRDDPARLLAYQKLFGAPRPGWSFLTGSPAALASVWATLGVSYQKVPEAGPAPTDWLTGKPLTYDVEHQDVVFLIDASGHERWLVIGTPATGGAAPPPTLDHFLDAQGRSNLTQPEGLTWTSGDVLDALHVVTGLATR
jgi:cytochrome oxidase Cu insertion factor (SCO1/SenC/PrrC family)